MMWTLWTEQVQEYRFYSSHHSTFIYFLVDYRTSFSKKMKHSYFFER